MAQIDIKSALIGFLGSCLLFVLIGADEKEPSNANFGDIVVNSITIKDDGHGGFITANFGCFGITVPFFFCLKDFRNYYCSIK